MFPSEYVAAVEFKGRDVVLTIAGVQIEQLMRQGSKQKEDKPILLFKETKKKMVLNKTNAGTIADLYGVNAEKWVGHKVALYPTTTHCGRDTVDCIRVRPVRPTGETPLPPKEVLADPEPRQEQPDDFQALADTQEAGPQLPPASASSGTQSPTPGASAKGTGAVGKPQSSETSSNRPMTDEEAAAIREQEAKEAGR